MTILSGISSGQATGDPREDFLYGDFYYTQSEFTKALPFYLSALATQPENSNYNFCVALCYLDILGKKNEALPYLEKAVLEIDKNYIPGKFKNTAAPAYAWFLLGDAYHRDNRLIESSYSYHQYLAYIDQADEKQLLEVRKRIVGLGISYEYQRDESIGLVFNLGELINSRFSDYNPVLSADQKTLIYTQYWESRDRIMYSTNTGRNWTKAIEINEQIGSKGNVYSTSLSADGNTLYLVNIAHDLYDIFYSERVDGKWTRMKPIPGKVNSKWRETSASVSEDGKCLYFSSDRNGGEGGVDLYVAEWNGEEWSEIKALGPIINTTGNEEAPYIIQSDSLLYFSSDGHESVGNMDILFSKMKSGGEWSLPINIGAPVNTTEDDISYIYFPATRVGFLARDLEGGYGKNDIYMYQPAGFFPITSSRTVESPSTEIDELGVTGSANPEDNFEIRDSLSTETIISEFSPEDTGTYTIQIMALNQKSVDPSYFNIPVIKVAKGSDGFFRYYLGQYKSYEQAIQDLERIRNSGFPDAFIQKMENINHYKSAI